MMKVEQFGKKLENSFGEEVTRGTTRISCSNSKEEIALVKNKIIGLLEGYNQPPLDKVKEITIYIVVSQQ